MFDVKAVTVLYKSVEFFLFAVFQTHIHGYRFKRELLGRKTAVCGKCGKKKGAVLSAREPDENPVAVLNHVVIRDCSAHHTQYFLHKTPLILHIIVTKL